MSLSGPVLLMIASTRRSSAIPEGPMQNTTKRWSSRPILVTRARFHREPAVTSTISKQICDLGCHPEAVHIPIGFQAPRDLATFERGQTGPEARQLTSDGVDRDVPSSSVAFEVRHRLANRAQQSECAHWGLATLEEVERRIEFTVRSRRQAMARYDVNRPHVTRGAQRRDGIAHG